MSLTTQHIEALAPDQASLKAASKLIKPAKWPVLDTDKEDGRLIWGECQGSGSNPYRVVVDKIDHGYKCTCPSRKFPCKHALALMWMFAESSELFKSETVPDWALEWVSRRRKTGSEPVAAPSSGEKKNLSAAIVAEPPKPVDPKAEARKKALADKRKVQTSVSLFTATEELDQWIADQLRTGIAGLQRELTDRCRRIAARLVDGKAASLAGRIDEIPARVLELEAAIQPEALITELGKLVLISKAYRAQPTDPEIRRLLSTAENRQELIDNKEAPRIKDHWEVLGEMVSTRRDGLVAQSTWLLRLGAGDGPTFAELLDFYPASAGKRGTSHTPGDQFEAELAFFPARHLCRAVIVDRGERSPAQQSWPTADPGDLLDTFVAALHETPWLIEAPLLLGAGRIAISSTGKAWWEAASGGTSLPLSKVPSKLALGSRFENAVGIWNGHQLNLISGNSQWGKVSFDD